MNNKALYGTMKWFNVSKGYGFIAVEGMRDHFVHFSAIPPEQLSSRGEDMKGRRVIILEKQEGDKGPAATKVSLLNQEGNDVAKSYTFSDTNSHSLPPLPPIPPYPGGSRSKTNRSRQRHWRR